MGSSRGSSALDRLREAESELVRLFLPGSNAPNADEVSSLRSRIEDLRRAAEEEIMGPETDVKDLVDMLNQLREENTILRELMNAEAESIRLRREEDHLVTDQFLSPEEESRLAVESMVMQAEVEDEGLLAPEVTAAMAAELAQEDVIAEEMMTMIGATDVIEKELKYLLNGGNGPDGPQSGDGSPGGSSSASAQPAPGSGPVLSRVGTGGRLESHKTRLEALQRRKAALQAHLANDDMFDQLNYDAQRFKTEAVAFEEVAVEAEKVEEQHGALMAATPELADAATMTERALTLRLEAKRLGLPPGGSVPTVSMSSLPAASAVTFLKAPRPAEKAQDTRDKAMAMQDVEVLQPEQSEPISEEQQVYNVVDVVADSTESAAEEIAEVIAEEIAEEIAEAEVAPGPSPEEAEAAQKAAAKAAALAAAKAELDRLREQQRDLQVKAQQVSAEQAKAQAPRPPSPPVSVQGMFTNAAAAVSNAFTSLTPSTRAPSAPPAVTSEPLPQAAVEAAPSPVAEEEEASVEAAATPAVVDDTPAVIVQSDAAQMVEPVAAAVQAAPAVATVQAAPDGEAKTDVQSLAEAHALAVAELAAAAAAPGLALARAAVEAATKARDEAAALVQAAGSAAAQAALAEAQAQESFKAHAQASATAAAAEREARKALSARTETKSIVELKVRLAQTNTARAENELKMKARSSSALRAKAQAELNARTEAAASAAAELVSATRAEEDAAAALQDATTALKDATAVEAEGTAVVAEAGKARIKAESDAEKQQQLVEKAAAALKSALEALEREEAAIRAAKDREGAALAALEAYKAKESEQLQAVARAEAEGQERERLRLEAAADEEKARAAHEEDERRAREEEERKSREMAAAAALAEEARAAQERRAAEELALADGSDLQAALERAWAPLEALAQEAADFNPSDEEERRFWKQTLESQDPEYRAVEGIIGQPMAKSGAWALEPALPVPGQTVTILYCPDKTPLRAKNQIIARVGFNAWHKKIDAGLPMSRMPESNERQGAWYQVEVEVPPTALCLDAVFTDGSGAWDNNDRRDFHAPLSGAREALGVLKLASAMKRFRAWQVATAEARQLEIVRQGQLKVLRAQAKASSERVLAKQQAQVMYTLPEQAVAGEVVIVRYNPNKTNLRGHSEIWVRGGYNRWSHDKRFWGPLRLNPASDGSEYFEVSVPVPPDVWSLDFVFSDTSGSEGGTYDNRDTLDYHVPVKGGMKDGKPTTEVKLHVVSISVEMAPIAKVGGLADVVTSLGRAVMEEGHKVEVILPKYDVVDYSSVVNMRHERDFNWGGAVNKVWYGEVEGLPTYFIDPDNGMFQCGCIYGADWKPIPLTDSQRFGFFSKAALEFLLQTGRQPDILHCHDWQTAPVAKYYWDDYQRFGLPNSRVVLTIHNMQYGAGLIGEAMEYCQKATTVSRTYAEEVSGHGALNKNLHKFRGIVNGIDPEIWDPYDDKLLPEFYCADTVVPGKAAAKAELRKRLNLQQKDVPIVGVVSRLTGQKGINLMKHAMVKALERGSQVVLLGSAPDPKVQAEFERLAETLKSSHWDSAALVFKFDEPLSHLVYAGSDMLLVPSIFEPCGLSQLIAMRYGTIPIVRKTGGLNDTVFDVDGDQDRAASVGVEPNGFSFDGQDNGALEHALNRALDMYFNSRPAFYKLQETAMRQDWSWNRPAKEYIELYYAATRWSA